MFEDREVDQRGDGSSNIAEFRKWAFRFAFEESFYVFCDLFLDILNRCLPGFIAQIIDDPVVVAAVHPQAVTLWAPI